MKNLYALLLSFKTQGLCLVFALFLLPNLASAQVSGDYRTNKTAVAWSNAADWDVYNGTTWSVAVSTPTASTNVYIQATHIATLSANSACNNLFISTGTTDAATGGDARVALVANTLDLNGKLSCYFGALNPAGSFGATASATIPSGPIATSSTTGKLNVVGNSRNVTVSAEWGNGNTSGTTTFNIEFNMNSGQTATILGSIKCQSWNIVSGIVDMRSTRMGCDNGTAGQGNITIQSGATVISSMTEPTVPATSAALSIASAQGARSGGIFDLKAGATLRLLGAIPLIDMTTVKLDGTVEYVATGGQTLLNVGLTATSTLPNTYNNLTVDATLPTTGKALAMNTTVNGILNLSSATLNAAPASTNFTLTVAGTVTKGTGFITANGTARLAFTNAASMTLPAAFLTTGSNVANLTINGGSITLGSNLGYNLALTLTTGKITLGAFNLTANTASSVSGASATSYVVTNGAGAFVKSVAITTSPTILFPIGSSTTYRPTTVAYTSNITTAGNLAGRFVGSAPGSTGLPLANEQGVASIATISPTGYWSMVSNTTLGGVYTITVDASNFFKENNSTAISSMLGVRLIKRPSAGSWALSNSTTSADPSALSTISAAGLDGFSEFGIAGFSTSLPIELTDFKAKRNVSATVLLWATASEKNNAYFDIQRSTNGVDFSTIGQVKGNGTTIAENRYTYEDATPSVSANYYRLRQVDFDATEAFSKVVSVMFDNKNGKLSIYPTLATDRLNIVSDNYEGTYSIFNLFGQNVQTGNILNNKELIISNLSTGTYILKVGNAAVKFVKN